MILHKEHQISYNQNGYFIVDNFVDASICEELSEKLSVLDSKINSSFYTSGYSTDIQYKSLVDKIISKTITPSYYENYVEDMELFYANFLSKSKGEYSECVIHTDWSITDETKYEPLHIWIPLIDVSIQNGTLAFIKGSHKLTNIYRGYNTRHYYDEFYDILKSQHATYMEVKAGTGVFYHPGLIHFSPSNNTDIRRNALLLSFYPKDTQPIIYYKSRWSWNKNIDVYKLTKEFYTIWDKKCKPESTFIKTVKEPRMKTDLKSFIQLL